MFTIDPLMSHNKFKAMSYTLNTILNIRNRLMNSKDKYMSKLTPKEYLNLVNYGITFHHNHYIQTAAEVGP